MTSTASLNPPRGKCVGGSNDASLELWFRGRELDALGYRIRPHTAATACVLTELDLQGRRTNSCS